MATKTKVILIVLTTFIWIPLVYAATTYSSGDVFVDNSLFTTSVSSNLKEAIDEINYFCSNNCPSGYSCKNNTPKCIRATTLHTEECLDETTSTNCRLAGYSLNSIVTYGNQTTTPGVLTVGDAFDCDVNGDGNYTERFYYISDYYDTETKKFNDKVAVLIYYSNVVNGVAANKSTIIDYDCSGANNHGPIDVLDDLPTTDQWSNIKLYKNNRKILSSNNNNTTSKGELPESFDYSGHAARLITKQEVDHSCYDFNISTDTKKGLKKCEFLFEVTKYTNPNNTAYGSWTETPSNDIADKSYEISATFCFFTTTSTSFESGIRPAIELLKSEISY